MAVVDKILVRVNDLVTNLDGDALKEPIYKGRDDKGNALYEDRDTTVGRAIIAALNGINENQNKGLPMGEKLDRFKLSVKIHDSIMPVEISEKEKELILRLVNEQFPSPLVVARINQAIVSTKIDEEKGAALPVYTHDQK
jgi:hypothetical protein